MKGRAAWRGLAVVLMVIGLILAGCATGPSSSPTSSQADLLKAAGFRMQTATTSQGMAYVNTLPAKKVVLNQYQDKPLYLVCTDPDAKQCFLGDEAAYQRYQQLAIQQSYSEEQRDVQEHRWDPEALQMWVDAHGGG